jgi:hypothetical protein
MKIYNMVFGLLMAAAMIGCGTENPFDRGIEFDTGIEEGSGTEEISFSAMVIPALSVCAGCHSSGTGGWTYGGGADAYSQVIDLINVNDPETSLLLVKGSGGEGHGGGTVLASSSSDYADIVAWVNAGASNN